MQSFEWFRNIPAVIIPNLQLNKSVYSESHSASVLSASQVDCLDIFPPASPAEPSVLLVTPLPCSASCLQEEGTGVCMLLHKTFKQLCTPAPLFTQRLSCHDHTTV